MHTRNYFKNKILKEDYQKPFKKLTLLFLLNSVPINWQTYEKQKGSGTSEQSLFKLQKKVQKNFFIRYILSDQVWWCNVKQFLSYAKNYSKFMQVNSWHHKLFYFHLSFWTWNMWKGREKITKTWISQEQKELFRWNKKHFL